jgi:chorismate mutase
MKKPSSVNNGIQARTLQANAVAAGKYARATATLSVQHEAVLNRLAEAVEQLPVDAERRDALLTSIKSMSHEVAAPENVSTFDKIVTVLKEVGHVAELVGPLKAVAAAFGLPIVF